MAGRKKKRVNASAPTLRKELKAAEERHQTAKREARQAKEAAKEAKRDVKRLRKLLEKSTAQVSARKKTRKSAASKRTAGRAAQTSPAATVSERPKARRARTGSREPTATDSGPAPEGAATGDAGAGDPT